MAKKTFPPKDKKKSPSGNLPSADFKSCKIILQSKGVSCCNLQISRLQELQGTLSSHAGTRKIPPEREIFIRSMSTWSDHRPSGS